LGFSLEEARKLLRRAVNISVSGFSTSIKIQTLENFKKKKKHSDASCLIYTVLLSYQKP